MIGAVQGQAASAARQNESQRARMDYDAFLTLLVAEMRNQDPTAPQDPKAMLSQLATFSNVEQQIKTNEKLDALLGAGGLGDAAALIGRTASSADGTITGAIVSVTVTAGGMTLNLADGRSLAHGPGLTIS